MCKHVATSIDSDTAVKPDGVKAATPTPSGSRIDRAEELSKILQVFLMIFLLTTVTYRSLFFSVVFRYGERRCQA